MAKTFTRLRKIFIYVKEEVDPENNSRLRAQFKMRRQQTCQKIILKELLKKQLKKIL